jgi:hypothetical protein
VKKPKAPAFIASRKTATIVAISSVLATRSLAASPIA